MILLLDWALILRLYQSFLSCVSSLTRQSWPWKWHVLICSFQRKWWSPSFLCSLSISKVPATLALIHSPRNDVLKGDDTVLPVLAVKGNKAKAEVGALVADWRDRWSIACCHVCVHTQCTQWVVGSHLPSRVRMKAGVWVFGFYPALDSNQFCHFEQVTHSFFSE